MNKKYYNYVLDNMIEDLHYKIEEESREIEDTATLYEYHTENDNVDLKKYEIESINEARQKMFVYHLLICDLEELRKEV